MYQLKTLTFTRKRCVPVAERLRKMQADVARLQKDTTNTLERARRLSREAGIYDEGDGMSTVWKELTARCLEWDPGDTKTNDAFVGAVVKIFGGNIVPAASELQKLAKSDTVSFTKSDVERFAAMLGGASAWEKYPAVTAMWEHAPLDKRETVEPITKSWTQQDVAERALAVLDAMAEEQGGVRGIAKELAYAKILETDEGRLLFEASQARGVSAGAFVRKVLGMYENTSPVLKVAEALGGGQ